MRKTLLAVSIASAFAVPSLASAQSASTAAPASPHTFTGNLSLVSDYRFRGITQTFEKPAIQGGFDYAHASGFYAGNWNSNVSSGAGFPGGNVEMDFYGGWKKSFGDFGVDVGTIYYYYPGTDASAANGTLFVNPVNGSTHAGKVYNHELYLGASWKWLSLKVYDAISDYFSLPGTRNSYYWDLSANYDVGNGWGVVGHIGKLKLKGWDNGTDLTKGSYTDYKLGVTKDVSGWVLGASLIGTDARGSCDAANPGFYCFGNSFPGPSATKDAGKSTLVFSVSKTF